MPQAKLLHKLVDQEPNPFCVAAHGRSLLQHQGHLFSFMVELVHVPKGRAILTAGRMSPLPCNMGILAKGITACAA